MRVVKKGWGHELIWADHTDYCGKNLVFKTGGRSSMHFHLKKDETWYIASGAFDVHYIDTTTAVTKVKRLVAGDTWHNPAGMPHQLVCADAGTVVEASTHDDPNDNYRVAPGDSQA